MKRSLCCLLGMLLLLSCVLYAAPAMETEATFVSPSQLYDIHNIDLAYTFAPKYENNLRQTVESFLPNVGYRLQDGTYADTFMDSFLFLPCVTTGPSGGCMYETSDYPNAISSDWVAYVDDLFAKGYNVEALNTATSIVGNALGQPDLQVNVFFTVLYPHKGQTNFGSLGGQALNFTSLEDRKRAVRWLVDEQLARFSKINNDHLRVSGFYWFEEFLQTGDPDEKELLQYFNSYVHSLGYKTIWIPYYRAKGWNQWKAYGFDVACMQPNLMWMNKLDENRVADCITRINQYDMCMEMEMDSSVFSNKYDYYMSYLREGVRTGVNQSINMYYQGGAPSTLYYACKSESPRERSIYDLTYRYAKNKLTLDEIPSPADYLTPSAYKNVALGKPYTASTPYTGDGSVGYQKIDGKELTDGITDSNLFSTAWHGFHISYREPDGRFAITIDLGQKMDDLGYFALLFGKDLTASVGLPSEIRISVSDDGVNFKELATIPDRAVNEGTCLYTLFTETCSARYIRATFGRQSSGAYFVFCSEFIVGQRVFLPGDADEDGVLSAYDSVLLAKYLAGFPDISSKRLDVNQDGFIGADDSTLLLKRLAGVN